MGITMGIILTRNECQKGREWRGSCCGRRSECCPHISPFSRGADSPHPSSHRHVLTFETLHPPCPPSMRRRRHSGPRGAPAPCRRRRFKSNHIQLFLEITFLCTAPPGSWQGSSRHYCVPLGSFRRPPASARPVVSPLPRPVLRPCLPRSPPLLHEAAAVVPAAQRRQRWVK